MLKDIFRYDFVIDQYVRRPMRTLWKVWFAETGGIATIVSWDPPITIGPRTYHAYDEPEKAGRMVFLEARDELEAFMKASKMEAEKCP